MYYQNPSAKTNFNRKLKKIFLSSVFALIGISARLFQLQCIKSSDLSGLSTKNFLKRELVVSPRGNIVDSHGQLLATNRPVTSLYWQGTGNSKLTAQQHEIIEELITTLAIQPSMQDISITERRSKTILLAHDIKKAEVSVLVEQFPNHPNLKIETAFERYYPHTTTASHMVGYLGSLHIDPTGKMGLEKALEEKLKGQDGVVEKTVNALGKKLSERQLKNSMSGATIATTIDLDMQLIAEKSFPSEFSGAFIIMEAETGAIKALVSRPNFDPNIFLKPILKNDWASLQDNQPFINRACSACYPPASPFKLVVIAAAFDLGLIDETTTWNCRGSVTFGNRIHYCNKKTGHGVLNAKQALAQSCNIPFFELAKIISINTIATYSHQFGLGQKTNCLLPEKAGLVPTSSWKEATLGQHWWPGETLSAFIGQSYYLVTPLQMVRMVGGIITGELAKPRILMDEPIEKISVRMNPSVRKFLKNSMRMVVTTGTGRWLNRFNEIKIYAKTGTAQVCSLDKENKTERDRHHAWCISHIKFKQAPALNMAILIEHAGVPRYALDTAKKFLQNYGAIIT